MNADTLPKAAQTRVITIPTLNPNGTRSVESLTCDVDLLFLYGENGCGKTSLLAKTFKSASPAIYLDANRDIRSQQFEVSDHAYSSYMDEIARPSRENYDRGGRWHVRTVGDRVSHLRTTDFDIVMKGLAQEQSRFNTDIVRKLSNGEPLDVSSAILESPIHLVNDALQSLGYRVRIVISDEAKVGMSAVDANVYKPEMVLDSSGQSLYEVKYMSDGERAVIFLLGHTLLAAPKSLILIDEPNKHIYNDYLLPVLYKMWELRKDCNFIAAAAENLGRYAEMLMDNGVYPPKGLNWGGLELTQYRVMSDGAAWEWQQKTFD